MLSALHPECFSLCYKQLFWTIFILWRKNKKATKTRKSESGGKDSDSRASTPLADKSTAVKIKGGPASTPSSSQDSSSDVPRKKRGRLDPTVETVSIIQYLKIFCLHKYSKCIKIRKLSHTLNLSHLHVSHFMLCESTHCAVCHHFHCMPNIWNQIFERHGLYNLW